MLMSRYLRPTLGLVRLSYAYLDMHRRVDLDGVIFIYLAWLAQKALNNISLVLQCSYFHFFVPVTSFLTWPQMTTVNIISIVRL